MDKEGSLRFMQLLEGKLNSEVTPCLKIMKVVAELCGGVILK